MDQKKKDELLRDVKAFNKITNRMKAEEEKYFNEQDAFINSNPRPDWSSLEKSLLLRFSKVNQKQYAPQVVNLPQENNLFYEYARQYYFDWTTVLEELSGRTIGPDSEPIQSQKTTSFFNDFDVFRIGLNRDEDFGLESKFFPNRITLAYPKNPASSHSFSLILHLDFALEYSKLNNSEEFNLIVYGFNPKRNNLTISEKNNYTKHICKVSTTEQWLALGYPNIEVSGTLWGEQTKQMKLKIELLLHQTIKELINEGPLGVNWNEML